MSVKLPAPPNGKGNHWVRCTNRDLRRFPWKDDDWVISTYDPDDGKWYINTRLGTINDLYTQIDHFEIGAPIVLPEELKIPTVTLEPPDEHKDKKWHIIQRATDPDWNSDWKEVWFWDNDYKHWSRVGIDEAVPPEVYEFYKYDKPVDLVGLSNNELVNNLIEAAISWSKARIPPMSSEEYMQISQNFLNAVKNYCNATEADNDSDSRC
jgi:hypothetical protein